MHDSHLAIRVFVTLYDNSHIKIRIASFIIKLRVGTIGYLIYQCFNYVATFVGQQSLNNITMCGC